jgi:putative transposase
MKNYRRLFRGRIAEKALEEIRESTNKSWVLGDEKFRRQVEKVTGRVVAPRKRGGDRKSGQFKENQRL